MRELLIIHTFTYVCGRMFPGNRSPGKLENQNMRRTKQAAAITREEILQAALIVFSKKGYAKTSLEDIAQAAGVTRGAIYWNFQNKADLFNTLATEKFQRAFDIMESEVHTENARAALIERMEAFLRSLRDDETLMQIRRIAFYQVELSEELRPFQEYLVAVRRKTVNQFTDIISKGQARGEFSRDLDPYVVALGYVALGTGLIQMWVLDPELNISPDTGATMAKHYLAGLQ